MSSTFLISTLTSYLKIADFTDDDMERKFIIFMVIIFGLGILVGYFVTNAMAPNVGLFTTTGYLVGKSYPCDGDVCPTLIVYAVDSDDGRILYLTKNGDYCPTLEFDGSFFEMDDYVEVTGIVYTKTVNQGIIFCIEWYSVTLK